MDPVTEQEAAVPEPVIEQWYDRGKLVGGIGSDSLEKLLGNGANYIFVISAIFGQSDLSLLDLGSGVGIPGIPIALQRDNFTVSLMDSMARRINVAREFIPGLNLDSRVSVLHGRSDEYFSAYAERYDVVVSRCFGPPPLVAEVAIRFLKPGGVLVVSDPPDVAARVRRWPKRELRAMGYGTPMFYELDQHFVALRRRKVSLRPLRAYRSMVKTPLWNPGS